MDRKDKRLGPLQAPQHPRNRCCLCRGQGPWHSFRRVHCPPPPPGRAGALPDRLHPLQAGSGQAHSPFCRSLLTRQLLRSEGAVSSPCAVRRRSQPVHERRTPHAPGGPGGQSGRQSCLRLRLWENSSWQRFWSDVESKPLGSVGGDMKWCSPGGNCGGAKQSHWQSRSWCVSLRAWQRGLGHTLPWFTVARPWKQPRGPSVGEHTSKSRSVKGSIIPP